MQKKITFENRNAQALAGVLHLPESGQPHACAIFAHCFTCNKTSGRIDRFSREISLRGDLDEEQRQLLLKIADRCPVHRTLENEITIASKLV